MYSGNIHVDILLEILCPDLTAPANGQVVVNGMTPGDTATYSCDMGFELDGVETVTCGDNGAWSARPPVCRREFRFLFFTTDGIYYEMLLLLLIIILL